MKMRNKGKVHPFTSNASSSSSSSSSSSASGKDAFTVLNLLPAAILALVSVLSLEDREVLAYMITRSLKSANPSSIPAQDNKKIPKKQCLDGHGHKSPALFDCDCFHCYTSFWFRWDSSPNRELIHQAIEAFEEQYLNNGADPLKKTAGNGKNKRKDKMGRRKIDKVSSSGGGGGDAGSEALQFGAIESPGYLEIPVVVVPESELVAEEVDDVGRENRDAAVESVPENELEARAVVAAAAPAVVVRNHKGFARKVLPDVMGIFSSRLWSLWSPNV